MNGEVGNGNVDDVEPDDDVEEIASTEDTVVLSEDAAEIDDVGDLSAEIKVEKLVAKVEAGDLDAEAHTKDVRKRLDEAEERRREEQELDSTYNFNLDEELS